MPSPLPRHLRLSATAVALRLSLPLRVAQSSLPALLDALSRGTIEPAPLDAIDEALARADAITHRLPFVPDTCLYRSLARFSLLRRAGHAARFVMGLSRPGEIEGHAWVELDGTPYGEELSPDLIVTYAYPCLNPKEPAA
ncbi:lasso peptide biosynthesis B2 protein [Polyangium jinanense]|uniref:Lasso peptide biosynthesis B2 protein n=1 Tax=Polyangium jinanense TaxID=2829994 RepID=A0A9X3X7A5_9BACT|nr:lasso peptide biosynthesis B2 protein [Polyangium jinanense]MDC3957517.1 lasso peptide biosynthesis B2 protein [Polyangium jinanense]MDC3984992.1 lasso peptide biosynthesis B2 protein [Polyangium jinanense]